MHTLSRLAISVKPFTIDALYTYQRYIKKELKNNLTQT